MALPAKVARTLFKGLFPARFWNELKPEHAIRPGRLLAFIATLLIVLYLVFAVSLAFASVRCWPHHVAGDQFFVDVPNTELALHAALRPFSGESRGRVRPEEIKRRDGAAVVGTMPPRAVFEESFVTNRPVRSSLEFITALAVLCPIALVGIVRLGGARGAGTLVTRAHIGRIFAYGLGGWAILAGFIIASAPGIYGRLNGFAVWHYEHLETLIVVASGAYFAAWWAFASSRYLCLPRGAAAGLEATAVGLAGAWVMVTI